MSFDWWFWCCSRPNGPDVVKSQTWFSQEGLCQVASTLVQPFTVIVPLCIEVLLRKASHRVVYFLFAAMVKGLVAGTFAVWCWWCVQALQGFVLQPHNKDPGCHPSITFHPHLQYSHTLHLLLGFSKRLKPRQSSQLCQCFKAQPVKFIAGDIGAEATTLTVSCLSLMHYSCFALMTLYLLRW